jgi:hypothetical protein
MMGNNKEGRAEMMEQVAKREDIPVNPSFQLESGPFLRTAPPHWVLWIASTRQAPSRWLRDRLC